MGVGTLGGLVTRFGSNTDELSRGIKQATSGLSGFASSATSFLNPLTAGFVALTAAAVGAGLGIKGVADRIGTLAGIADKAAQTGLSGSFLQQLGYAADQSGVSAETLTKAISKLTVVVGQAANGSSTAADGFSDLGISIKELQSLTPEQQFLRVAEQIGKIPDAAGRAAAAVKIFGKSGVEMTTLFSGGLNDINALMKEAAALGIGIDAEGLAKIAAADDAIQQMKASFGGLLDQVAVGLAPAFSAVAAEVTALVPPVTELFAQFNSLDDKFQFTADLLVAAFDVAVQTIKEKFGEMLSGIVTLATDAGRAIIRQLNPATWAEQLGLFGGGGQPGAAGESGLAAAQKQLDEVLGRLQQAQPGIAAPVQGIAAGPAGPAMTAEERRSRDKHLAEAEKSLMTFGRDALKFGADLKAKGGKLFDAAVGGAQSLWKNMTTPEKDPGPQFASVMLRGSSAAINTINSAGGMSPAVKIANDQLKVQKDANKLHKQIADNTKPRFAPEFA